MSGKPNTALYGLTLTLFQDRRGFQCLEKQNVSLDAISELILSTSMPSKAELPLLKLAKFGKTKTLNGSLRHNANVISITGIEADYDAGGMSFVAASTAMAAAGITAIVYTSPSHTESAPRWRILCPTSQDLPTNQRIKLLDRLNGVLGGVLAAESWILSQSFYFGAVANNPAPKIRIIDGNYIDLMPNLDASAIEKPGSLWSEELPPSENNSGDQFNKNTARTASAMSAIPNEGGWEDWNKLGLAIYGATRGSDEGFDMFDAWSAKSNAYDAGTTWERWKHYRRSPPTQIGAGTIIHMAREHGWDEERWTAGVQQLYPQGDAPSSPLWIESSSWSEAQLPPRPWIVREYILRGALSELAGPGAVGKSTLIKAHLCSLVTGLPFGHFQPDRPYRVMSYNVEDDLNEERMRLSAALRYFNKTPRDLENKLFLCGPTEVGHLMTAKGREGITVVATSTLEAMRQHIRGLKIEVLYLDPLIELHNSKESDNTAMALVMSAFKVLAREEGIGVVIAVHTPKGVVTSGDQDAVRGAGTIVNQARIAHTVVTMTEADMEHFGVFQGQRKNYFHVEPAKTNYSSPHNGEWFVRLPVPLANQEFVAAAVPWEPPTGEVGAELVEIIRTALSAGVNGRPYSYSSNSRHKFTDLCRSVGVHGRAAQKQLQEQLELLGYRTAAYKDPDTRTPAKGIRCPDGEPDIEWK